MRNVFLFSLPLTIIAAAGCGSQPVEQPTHTDLQRDLTLVPTHDRAVASPIELGEVRARSGSRSASHAAVQRRAVHSRAALYPTTKVYEPSKARAAHPVIADVAVPNPGARPATAVPVSSHELPPGQTATVIPVMSGPSPSEEVGTDDMPVRCGTGGSGMGGGGSGMGGGGSGMGGGGSGMGGGFGGRPRGLLY
jgi:hypothetical protein